MYQRVGPICQTMCYAIGNLWSWIITGPKKCILVYIAPFTQYHYLFYCIYLKKKLNPTLEVSLSWSLHWEGKASHLLDMDSCMILISPFAIPESWCIVGNICWSPEDINKRRQRYSESKNIFLFFKNIFLYTVWS